MRFQEKPSLRGSQEENRELQWSDTAVTLFADMGRYPGYTGPLNPRGTIRVIFQENGMMQVKMYTFAGMEESIMDGGFHIHEGTTCDDADLVGPHYWNSDKVIDLWTTEGGAVYDTFPHGKPKGSFFLYDGFKVEDNVGHAVVAHAADGARIACGVLEYL